MRFEIRTLHLGPETRRRSAVTGRIAVERVRLDLESAGAKRLPVKASARKQQTRESCRTFVNRPLAPARFDAGDRNASDRFPTAGK
jgi:hypothetical protein